MNVKDRYKTHTSRVVKYLLNRVKSLLADLFPPLLGKRKK